MSLNHRSYTESSEKKYNKYIKNHNDRYEEDFKQQQNLKKEKSINRNQQNIQAKDLIDKLLDDNTSKENIGKFLDNIKNNNLINLDTFNRIGKGGTHDVYISYKDNGFVIKINRDVYNIINQNKGSKEIENRAKEFIQEKNNEYNKLYKHFGENNCLYEYATIQRIKINNDTISCPIFLQKSTDLFSKETLDFTTNYIEEIKQKDIETYKNLNTTLLTDSILDLKEDHVIKFFPKIKKIFNLIDSDTGFKKTTKEFLEKLQTYNQEEGKIIDLVGEKNVLFYKKDEKRQFKLGSVIKGDKQEDLNIVLNILETNPKEILSDIKIKNTLKNYLACIRMINIIAQKLYGKNIIQLHLTEKQIGNLNKLKI